MFYRAFNVSMRRNPLAWVYFGHQPHKEMNPYVLRHTRDTNVTHLMYLGEVLEMTYNNSANLRCYPVIIVFSLTIIWHPAKISLKGTQYVENP